MIKSEKKNTYLLSGVAGDWYPCSDMFQTLCSAYQKHCKTELQIGLSHVRAHVQGLSYCHL